MDQSEFQHDLRIDPEQLDVECVRQSEAFYKWAKRLVDSKKELDHLELAMEVLEAKLIGRIRQDPGKYGLEKATDASVKARVTSHPKLVKARWEAIEAKHSTGMLEKGVAAMEQKKRMLESLVTLHGQQYFATPSGPRNLVTEWKKFQGRVTSVTLEQKQGVRKRKGVR